MLKKRKQSKTKFTLAQRFKSKIKNNNSKKKYTSKDNQTKAYKKAYNKQKIK